MIILDNVYKSFDGRIVLNGVSFTVNRGECFVIIGLSGAGKSVTLKHIAGLLDPDRGDVVIDGTSMANSSERIRDSLRKKMGVVFQSGAMLNWMSVGENIALPLVERRQHARPEIDKRVAETLDVLQLTEAKDKMPAEISGGMKKRVNLARVLVRNPEIILYDEPTSGLDPVMSTMINDLIVRLRNRYKVTSVVVTHDMDSAYYIADRIAVLYKGEIIQCDTPDKIKESDHPVVQQFIHGEIEGPIKV